MSDSAVRAEFDEGVLTAVQRLLAVCQRDSVLLGEIRTLSQMAGTKSHAEFLIAYCDGYDDALGELAALLRREPRGSTETVDAEALLAGLSRMQDAAAQRDVLSRQLFECQQRSERYAAIIDAIRDAQFPDAFTRVADMLSKLVMDTPADQAITDDFVTMLRSAAEKATSLLGEDTGMEQRSS